MSGERPSVLVLFGGISSEHSISCVSAGSVMRAMDPEKYEIVPVGITRGGGWVRVDAHPDDLMIVDGRLPQVDPSGVPAVLSVDPGRRGVTFTPAEGGAVWQDIDVAFPVLHGPYGEDGTIQGLFEIAGLPYVGSGVFSSAACMDKSHTKQLLASAGLSVGRWRAVHRDEWDDATHDAVVRGLGWPVFVKPARAGSSVGVSKAFDSPGLHKAVAHAAEHDPHIIVEASVEPAREIECGVLVGTDGVARASVCAEIKVRAGHDFYDFEAKYLDDSVDLIVPADLPDDVHSGMRALALAAFRALDCEGLARVDMFVAADGLVSINEVNTMPGFTSISMYPQMWAASGVDYPTLIDTLLAEALGRSSGLR